MTYMQKNEVINVESLFSFLNEREELREIRQQAQQMPIKYLPAQSSLAERVVPLSVDVDLPPAPTGIIPFIRRTVWVPVSEMRGRNYATEGGDRNLNSVAKVMSLSTIWDFFTTIPLFSYALNAPLGAVAGPGAFGLSFLLLWASNKVGEKSTNRSTANAAKGATASLIAFVLLCGAKTAFSGVGVDLWISSQSIAASFAKDLAQKNIEANSQELERLSAGSASTQKLEKECESLEAELRGIDRSKDERNYQSIYVRAFGSFAERASQPTEGPINRINGVCRQRDASRELDAAKAKALDASLTQKRQAIESKPPLSYLQEFEPELYKEHFVERGGKVDFVSGTEAVGQGTKDFYGRLFTGQELGKLGFSLFSLVVSIILTAAAAILLYLASRDPHVKASFTTELEGYLNSRLDDYEKHVRTLAGSTESAPQPTVENIPSDGRGYEVEPLSWVYANGKPEEKDYAKSLYRLTLFQLWRKYVKRTGETYYEPLSDNLFDRYKEVSASTSGGYITIE